MQHEQSSPHQHGSLTTGFASGPLTIDGEEEPEVVEGGIVSVCGCWVLVAGSWLVVIAMIKCLLGGLMWWVVVSATGASADLECCRY